MSEPAPSLSVLMPVYNAELYLEQAVQSVLDQTFRDFEFIIIEDGSRDRSLKILEEFAARDPRIRLVSRPNTGYVVALNEGLGMARGEFIARMDADDVAMPSRFEHQIAMLQARPELAAVGGQLLMISPDGIEICKFGLLQSHDQIDAQHLESGSCAIGHPAVMIRRNALIDVGGYRPAFEPAEDLDLWLRLAERGRLANLPEVVLQYRVHAKSVSALRAGAQQDGARRALDEALSRRGLPSRTTDIRPGGNPTLPSQWSLLAADAGYYRSARLFARRAIREQPFKVESWRSWVSSMLGPRLKMVRQLRKRLNEK